MLPPWCLMSYELISSMCVEWDIEIVISLAALFLACIKLLASEERSL